VIILTDLFGGTPSNLAISLKKSADRGRSRGEPADADPLEGRRKSGRQAAVARARARRAANISRRSEILGERLTCEPSRRRNKRGLMPGQRQIRHPSPPPAAIVEVEKDGSGCGTSIMG
jgi:hypothetical protein